MVTLEDIVKMRHSMAEIKLEELREELKRRKGNFLGDFITGGEALLSGGNTLEARGMRAKAEVKLYRDMLTEAGIQFVERVPLDSSAPAKK